MTEQVVSEIESIRNDMRSHFFELGFLDHYPASEGSAVEMLRHRSGILVIIRPESYTFDLVVLNGLRASSIKGAGYPNKFIPKMLLELSSSLSESIN